MAKLIMTRGLPASGKTTWAKKYYDENPGSTKIICKDDLRDMLDCGRWSRAREEFIVTARDQLVYEALRNNYDVIVADTNLATKHESLLKEIAKDCEAEFEIKDFTDVPLKECIKRDQKRADSVGEDVIHRMWRQYLAEPHEPIAPSPEKRLAIIVDIDGTLAFSEGIRNPYDGSRCNEDQPNLRLMRVINELKSQYYIIVCTGREDKWQEETETWLDAWGLYYDEFYMRETDDHRKDAVIKKEIYDEYIKPEYQVDIVFDDRPQVIDMWKEEGLLVANVGDNIRF